MPVPLTTPATETSVAVARLYKSLSWLERARARASARNQTKKTSPGVHALHCQGFLSLQQTQRHWLPEAGQQRDAEMSGSRWVCPLCLAVTGKVCLCSAAPSPLLRKNGFLSQQQCVGVSSHNDLSQAEELQTHLSHRLRNLSFIEYTK